MEATENMKRAEAATRRRLYGGQDPREIPAYTPGEAARYLRIPFRSVHNWAFGFVYQTSAGEKRRGLPLIEPADRSKNLLSFVNMAELHVLDALRNYHQISPQRLRQLIAYLRRTFDSAHPLIDEMMFTDQLNVFVEKAGTLINATREGQYAMRQILEAHLQRIDQDVDGLAVRLYPFVRRKPDPGEAPREQPKVIALDPRVRFGRPVIVGTSIPTVEVAERFKAGDSVNALADEYGRPREEIEEVIRCELTLDAAA
jgi:uncharacterized protein (DUF433 family)